MAAGVQYIALLRGINVGGRNLVKMDELRAVVEEMGFEDVATYIASGNLLFRAPRQKGDELSARLEAELSRAFDTDLRVVVLTDSQLSRIVEDAPPGFGAASDLCDVIFLRKPLTASTALGIAEMREGVDRSWAGRGVVYFSRLAAKKTSSRLNKIVGTPEYKNMTIRSWATTTKLARLVESRR